MLLFQSERKRGCDGLWGIQRSKVAGACNEDSEESAGEQNKRIGNDRWQAIWLYAWEEHDSCVVYSKKMQEFRGREEKLEMCSVNLEKTFDRAPKKVME